MFEAIVNAVAHRDYTSNGSVQVMLFADRLEIWNPGNLPPSLSLEKLREHHGSVPGNPLLAEPLYLTKYIERMGTGTIDMISRCHEAGLPEPEFTISDGFVTTLHRKTQVTPEVTPQVTPQVERLMRVLQGEMTRGDLMAALNLKDRMHFINEYLAPALNAALIEMTIPDKPRSSKQKYRLTLQGKQVLKAMEKNDL